MVSCHVSCCEGRTLQCSILSDGVWDIFHMGQVTATTHYSAAVCGKGSLLRMLQHALFPSRSIWTMTMPFDLQCLMHPQLIKLGNAYLM